MTEEPGSVKVLEMAIRFVEQDPTHEAAWKFLAMLYERRGQHEAALAHFERAVAQWPDIAVTNNRLAWFLANCPDPNFRDADRAVKFARRAVELSPYSTSTRSAS